MARDATPTKLQQLHLNTHTHTNQTSFAQNIHKHTIVPQNNKFKTTQTHTHKNISK